MTAATIRIDDATVTDADAGLVVTEGNVVAGSSVVGIVVVVVVAGAPQLAMV